MTALDTAKAVLAKASLYDQTFAKPDMGILRAWAEAFDGITVEDAMQAVADHYGPKNLQTRRIMPADVIRSVRHMRAERIERAVENVPDLDADPDDVLGYLAALRGHRYRVADGTEKQRPVRQLLEGAIARMPSVPNSSELARKAFDDALRAKREAAAETGDGPAAS
jgi:hypothetical protein